MAAAKSLYTLIFCACAPLPACAVAQRLCMRATVAADPLPACAAPAKTLSAVLAAAKESALAVDLNCGRAAAFREKTCPPDVADKGTGLQPQTASSPVREREEGGVLAYESEGAHCKE